MRVVNLEPRSVRQLFKESKIRIKMTHFSFRGRRESPRGVSEHTGKMKARDPTYGGACCPVKSGGWKLRSRGMWPTAREAEARVGAQSLCQWYTRSALWCDRATITKPAAGHGGHTLQSEARYQSWQIITWNLTYKTHMTCFTWC